MTSLAFPPLHGLRVEDEALLRGDGRFVADRPEPGQLRAVFVRSPHAAAGIVSVSADRAASLPGVRLVLTGADMAREGGGNVTEHPPQAGRGGRQIVLPRRPALASVRVTHVGETVAMVVAQTLAIAEAAAALVDVRYAPSPAVTDVQEAVEPGAPQLWPDAPGNVALDWPGFAPDPEGNARAVAACLAGAAHVARLSLRHQRLIGNSLEPRGATASFDPADQTYVLRAGTQGARTVRDAMSGLLGIDRAKLRVVTEDVGGAFGFKVGAYPEYAALLIAARRAGQPVHWMSGRSEAFVSDTQARDSVTDGELALDPDGRFLALRVRHLSNLGAYVATVAGKAQTENFARCLPGCYAIPLVDMQSTCVFTNTVPTAPYRGAGRPEANYVVERLVDEAARLTGIDRLDLRRRNFVAPGEMPYRTAVGTTYDSGEFEAVLDKALVLSDHQGFAERRRRSEASGKLRGIGLCASLEHAGATPVEGAWLVFAGHERLELRTGVHSMGQGHATVFPRVLAERLGLRAEQVVHRQGDSAWEIAGYSAVGSRSAMHLTHAMTTAADRVVAKGREVAAIAFGAAEDRLRFEDGFFFVEETNLRLSLWEAAALSADLLAQGLVEETLDTKTATETGLTFPNGCHVAEVEIDPGTGHLELTGYACVDDCGNVLDPVIVQGQIHGSVAQGLGQALLEQAVFDDAGRPLASSFETYALPRATHMPPIRDGLHIVPATTNPMGVKGAGETGTVAAIAAVMNAIADAIPTEAGRRIDMPATSEKIWRACEELRRERSHVTWPAAETDPDELAEPVQLSGLPDPHP